MDQFSHVIAIVPKINKTIAWLNIRNESESRNRMTAPLGKYKHECE